MALGVGQCQANTTVAGASGVCVDMDSTEVGRVPGVSGCAEIDREERYGGRRGWMIDRHRDAGGLLCGVQDLNSVI